MSMLSARRHPRHVSAFTLLEILVVLVIIGVLVAAATLSVGVLGSDRELEDEARRFHAVLQHAREEAELQGIDLGVILAQTGYQYMRFDARQSAWVAIEEDRLYTPRQFPEGVRARLRLESRDVVLKPELPKIEEQEDEEEEEERTEENFEQGEDIGQPKKPSKVAPQLVILSSGEIMPFELELEREGGDARWQMIAKPDNTMELEEVDERT